MKSLEQLQREHRELQDEYLAIERKPGFHVAAATFCLIDAVLVKDQPAKAKRKEISAVGDALARFGDQISILSINGLNRGDLAKYLSAKERIQTIELAMKLAEPPKE